MFLILPIIAAQVIVASIIVSHAVSMVPPASHVALISPAPIISVLIVNSIIVLSVIHL